MSPEQYNTCVEDCADALYRFALKTLKKNDVANDVVQEAFEKLWIHRKKVEPVKARSYLFTVAYHAMIDEIRKNKRYEEHLGESRADEGYSDHYSDLNEVLHRAADRLPVVQRSVLMLRDYEGYSYQEIEAITGLNESQVKVYIYRARLQMRQYIGSLVAVL